MKPSMIPPAIRAAAERASLAPTQRLSAYTRELARLVARGEICGTCKGDGAYDASSMWQYEACGGTGWAGR